METNKSKKGNTTSKHVRLKRLLAPREIKFRGKDIENDKWIFGYYYVKHRHVQKFHHIISEIGAMGIEHEVSKETVSQFTGLTDNNGNEVYEGDIISEGIMKDLFTVIFTDYANFGLKPLTEEIIEFSKKQNRNFEHETIDPAYAETTLEVIGNIFENPELLE